MDHDVGLQEKPLSCLSYKFHPYAQRPEDWVPFSAFKQNLNIFLISYEFRESDILVYI